MSRRGKLRLGAVGLGVAGAGVVGGLAAERTLVRRIRQAPDPAAEDERRLAAGAAPTIERIVVTSDGGHLRVVERGEGPPVVLLHGITLSAEIWFYQLDELAAAGYRAIAFDQRGHGSSDIGKDGLSLGRLAADLAEILEQLDLDDVVLVGHSMGGMVALRFLAGDALSSQGLGLVASLALVATSASPVGGSGVPGAKVVAAVVRPLAARTAWLTSRLPGPSLPGNNLAFLLTRVVFGERPSPSQVALTERISAAVPAKVTAALLADIVRFDEAAALDKIDLPSAVVVGTKDVLTPIRHARAMVAAIGGAELVVLEGCGHMVMLERHDELTATLVELANKERSGTMLDG